MEVKITFGNGEIITAEKNGESLIAQQKLGFPAVLGVVTVESEDGVRTYNEPHIVECASIDGRFWFCFVEDNPQEKRIRQIEEKNAALMEATDDMILLMADLIGG